MTDSRRVPVLVEIGSKKAIATALSWSGWSRSAKSEEEALATLESYAARYKSSMGSVTRRFGFPGEPDIEVVERLDGGKTTDFGAPEVICEYDHMPLTGDDLERDDALLKAAWRAFERTASKYAGRDLRKGPRGGGRDIEKMTQHVFEADRAFASPVGAVLPPSADDDRAGVRNAFIQALRDRAEGRPHDTGRRTKKVWPPRYAARRSAWHSLDHAWEIEDKLID